MTKKYIASLVPLLLSLKQILVSEHTVYRAVHNLVERDYWQKRTDGHHHISVMELGHLFTRSGLTYHKPLQRCTMIPSARWGVVFHCIG